MPEAFIQKLTFAILVAASMGIPLSQAHAAEIPSAPLGLQCLDTKRIKVSQVLNEGILARLCFVDLRKFLNDPFENCNTEGDTVFLKVNPADNDYVDNQKVTLPENKCLVPDGTYSYTANGEKKRVRKVRIADVSP